jgi:hypothetical protein
VTKSSTHTVYCCKDKPHTQLCRQLDWFEESSVSRYDVHLWCHNDEASQRKEHWVTCHEGVRRQEILELWKWLRYMNAHKSDVYIRPHRFDRQSVIFLDDLDLQKAHRVAQKYSCCVLETSPNNTQVWMRTTHALTREERKFEQSYLSNMGHSDKGSISGDHFGRLAGVVSHKRKCWVNMKYFSTPRSYEPTQKVPHPSHGGGGACASPHQNHVSNSEREFGWAVGMLRNGTSHQEVLAKVLQAARLRNKRNAESYASMTIKKAVMAVNDLTEFDRM